LAQELAACDLVPFYWASDGKAEVDFVFSTRNKLFAAEVKAGINLKSQSLSVLKSIQEEANLIVASLAPYAETKKHLQLPLYRVGEYVRNE
jgi:predicted AAA+ superfamily ATPase